MIISRQLVEGMTLLRGKEILTIKTLEKNGRSCTAIVTNAKGKTEKLSITNMWDQKIKISTTPKIEEAVKKTKGKELFPAAVKHAKRIIKNTVAVKRTKTVPLIKKSVKRANGVASAISIKHAGLHVPLFSSWKRSK